MTGRRSSAEHHQRAVEQFVHVDDLEGRAVELRVLLRGVRPAWRSGWWSRRSRSSAVRSRPCSSASGSRPRGIGRRRRWPRSARATRTSRPACTNVGASSQPPEIPWSSSQSPSSSSRSAASSGVSVGAFATCSAASSCNRISVASACRSYLPDAMKPSLCRMPRHPVAQRRRRPDRGRRRVVQLVGEPGGQRTQRQQAFPLLDDLLARSGSPKNRPSSRCTAIGNHSRMSCREPVGVQHEEPRRRGDAHRRACRPAARGRRDRPARHRHTRRAGRCARSRRRRRPTAGSAPACRRSARRSRSLDHPRGTPVPVRSARRGPSRRAARAGRR